MLQRVWKKGNPLALLVGMEIGALTTENSMEFLKKLKIVSLLGIYTVVVQMLSRVRLCDPLGCSTPGLPVHHQLLEFTQTHVHRLGDAIQPSHPLLSPSPLAFNLSQHQGLFQ